MGLTSGWPKRGERLGGVEIDHRRADAEAAVEIDAELLDHVALHFRDRHLEHDLVAAVNRDAVDDLACRRRPAATAISNACCASTGLADVAGQHDAVAQAFDMDVGVRQRLLERGAQAVEVAGDRDVEAGDLPALGVEEDRRWSGRP